MNFLKIIILLILIGVVYIIGKIQVLLSKKENKIYGLILPFLVFVLSLILSFGTVPTTISTDTEIQTVSEEGTMIKNDSLTKQSKIPMEQNFSIGSIIYVLIIVNIATISLLVIYIMCKRKMALKEELKKMRLKELWEKLLTVVQIKYII